MKPRPSRSQLFGISAFRHLLIASSLLAAVTAHAQTWDGSSSGSWNTAANWSTNSVPGANAAITFYDTGATNLNTTTNARFTLNSITFNSTASSPVTINTTASPIAFNAGTAIRFNAGTNLSVSAGDHKIVGTGVNGGSEYDVIFNGASGSTHTFSIASGASFEIQGRIHHGSTNNKTYAKTGSGTLILSGFNGGSSSWGMNASKAFQVQQGVLRLANLNAAGLSSNNYIVSSGAALELSGGFNQTVNNGVWTLNGSGIGGNGALRSISGNNQIVGTGTGGLDLASSSTIGVDTGASLTIAPVISGSGALNKVGDGTLTLSGDNTYSGPTTVSAGVLQIGNGGTTGTLGNNSNTSIAAGAELRIERSTESFGYSYTGELSGSGTVSIAADRRFNFQTNNQTASGNLSFNVNGALGINTSSGVTAVQLGELSGSGSIYRASGAGGAATLFIGGKNTDSSFSGGISAPELGVEKVGNGTLILASSNGYAGTTLVSAGTLLVNGSLGNSSVTVDPAATLGGTGSIGGSLSFDAGSFLQVVDFSDPLAVAGSATFGSGFGIANLLGIDWDSLDLDTPYTVLSTSQTFGESDIANFGFDNRVAVGSLDREAYFTSGSLNVVVIPEPRAALLGGLGLLILLRRRRGNC